MAEAAAVVLGPSNVLTTDSFLIILQQWASSDPSALSRIRVSCVMHNKMPQSPEHEYLVIETVDSEGKIKLLILERTVGETAEKPDIPGDGHIRFLKSIKEKIVGSLDSGAAPYNLLEEGYLLDPHSLSFIDKVTTLCSQSSNSITNSLNDLLRNSPAIDRFLGEKFALSPAWHGQCIRHFKPTTTFTLFQLALLADLVHNSYPNYTLLGEQCYFFAGLIYSAAKHHFGQNADENADSAYIENSFQLRKFGRWNGVMVQSVDPQKVCSVVENFLAAERAEAEKVI